MAPSPARFLASARAVPKSLWQRFIWQPAAARPAWAALIAGLVLPLAYPPFYALPIFYAATALVMCLAVSAAQEVGVARLAWLGWCFGFGQFASGMAWIGEAFLVEAELFLWALPFAVTGLPAGLALFHGAAFAAFAWLRRRLAVTRLAQFILLALLLSLSEFARGHVLTGLPWNLPVMGWAGWLYLAQPAALMGIYGLSLLALLSVALLASLHRPAVIAALALPVLAFIWSVFALNATPRMAATETKLTVVQPNLAQREKWQADYRDRHVDKTFRLTALGLKYAPDTDLIIWPETAIPALIDEGEGFAERLAAAMPVLEPRNEKDGETKDSETKDGEIRKAAPYLAPYLLTGAIRREIGIDKTSYYNSAMLWSGAGHLLARTDKHHLVPFGEYLPAQGLLEAIGLEQLTRLRGGYAAGPKGALLSAARLPALAPLICYEAVFPHLSRHADAARPAALINLTNDGWFGESFGPYQHLAQARLRAIEQGLPLIRAANTGMSAAFDARGRQLERLALGEEGVFSLPLPAALPPTLYARFGELGFWLLWGLVLMFVWARRKRGR